MPKRKPKNQKQSQEEVVKEEEQNQNENNQYEIKNEERIQNQNDLPFKNYNHEEEDFWVDCKK